MIPGQPQPQQPMTQAQVQDMVDRSSPWDQFNQHLVLTVQALQRLHLAFDGKFTRGPI